MSKAVPKRGFSPRPGKKECCKRCSVPSKWPICTQAAAQPKGALNQEQSLLQQNGTRGQRQAQTWEGRKKTPTSLFCSIFGVIRVVVVSLCLFPTDLSWTTPRPTPLAWMESFVLFYMTERHHALIFLNEWYHFEQREKKKDPLYVSTIKTTNVSIFPVTTKHSSSEKPKSTQCTDTGFFYYVSLLGGGGELQSSVEIWVFFHKNNFLLKKKRKKKGNSTVWVFSGPELYNISGALA